MRKVILLLSLGLSGTLWAGPFDALRIPIPYSDEDFYSLEENPSAAAYAAKVQLSELNKRTVQLNEEYSFVSCDVFQDLNLSAGHYYMTKVNLTVKLSDWRVKESVNPPKPAVKGLILARGDRVIAWWVSEETFDKVLRSKNSRDIDTEPFEVEGNAIFIERR